MSKLSITDKIKLNSGYYIPRLGFGVCIHSPVLLMLGCLPEPEVFVIVTLMCALLAINIFLYLQVYQTYITNCPSIPLQNLSF